MPSLLSWSAHTRDFFLATEGLVEDGVEKCHLYWPEETGEAIIYGNLSVTLTAANSNAIFATRRIMLKNSES